VQGFCAANTTGDRLAPSVGTPSLAAGGLSGLGLAHIVPSRPRPRGRGARKTALLVPVPLGAYEPAETAPWHDKQAQRSFWARLARGRPCPPRQGEDPCLATST